MHSLVTVPFVSACCCNGVPFQHHPQHSSHLPEQEEDSDIESASTVSETNQSFLERSLLAAVTDQNSRESGSSPSASLPKEEQNEQVSRRVSRRPTNPQQVTPALFLPWQEIATQLGIPVEHEAPTENLRAMFQTAIGILTADQQREFHQLQGTAFSQLPHHIAPVENDC